jgi:mRNA interferase RelE/StbE
VKLDPTRDALDFLLALDAKRYKQVTAKMLSLLSDPAPADSQQLKGYDLRRADIGEFRIIYRVGDDTIVIELIGRRNDDAVYKQLERKQG